MSNLWILGSDKVEEEGECECGNTVILSRYLPIVNVLASLLNMFQQFSRFSDLTNVDLKTKAFLNFHLII